MNKPFKTIAMAAAALIAVGFVISLAAFALGAPVNYYWDDGLRAQPRGGWSEESLTTQSERLAPFTEMELDTGAYQIVFERTAGEYELIYSKPENESTPEFHVENGKLKLDADDHYRGKFTIPIIGWNNGWDEENMRKITIRFPQDAQMKEISIDSDISDLELRDLTVDRLDLDLKMGSVTLGQIQAKQMTISASMGSVEIEDCSADSADIDLKMGSLDAEKFETKALEADAKMGSVELDGTFSGTSEIGAAMGSVTVRNRIARESCSLDFEVSLGNATVDGNSFGTHHNDSEKRPNRMRFDVELGDANLSFVE